jgi:DNA-binding NarL/FixJ family response regulator
MFTSCRRASIDFAVAPVIIGCTLVPFENQSGSLNGPDAVPQIRLYLTIQNRLLREALVRLFRKRADLVVAGESSPSDTRAATVFDSQCNVLLLDSLHLAPGSREQAALAAPPDAVKTILIGMDADEEQFIAAVRAGVLGYLLKDASTGDVIAAVRTVSRGEAFCPPRLCRALFRFVALTPAEFPAHRNTKPDLTLRQQQLISLVAQGLTNKEIACRLKLSEFTVRNHIHRILKQVDAENRSQAVEAVRSHGYFVGAGGTAAEHSPV